MKIKLILIFLISLLVTSCEFKPVYKGYNEKIKIINTKTFLGNSKISREIFYKLMVEESTSQTNLTLTIKTDKEKIPLSKNKSGKISIFKLSIATEITLSDNKSVVFKESFTESFTYQNNDNKFELSKLEKNLEYNLIEQIADKINKKLIETK